MPWNRRSIARRCGARKQKLLRSVPAVGRSPSLLYSLIAELGTLGRRQIVALVGVASFNCDNGKMRGTRASSGRSRWQRPRCARCATCCTRVAARRNPVLRAFIFACAQPARNQRAHRGMRKLLIMLNA